MTSDSDNLAAARRYLAAIERGATGDDLAAFYTPDVVERESPNPFMPLGATRRLPQILEGAERGQHVMRGQRFEVLQAVADGDHVALEVQWTGKLAIAVAGLPAGCGMQARFAVFLEYRDGKIARQRNYYYFDAW